MCEIYVKADPILYESRTRAIRIHGVVTSIRLENLFWDILTELAASEGRTTNQLVVKFHDEIMAHRGEVANFASFLRVTCLRYLKRTNAEAENASSRAALAIHPAAVTSPPMLVAVGAPAAKRRTIERSAQTSR